MFRCDYFLIVQFHSDFNFMTVKKEKRKRKKNNIKSLKLCKYPKASFFLNHLVVIIHVKIFYMFFFFFHLSNVFDILGCFKKFFLILIFIRLSALSGMY